MSLNIVDLSTDQCIDMWEDIDISNFIEELIESVLHKLRAFIKHEVSELKQKWKNAHKLDWITIREEIRDHFNDSCF